MEKHKYFLWKTTINWGLGKGLQWCMLSSSLKKKSCKFPALKKKASLSQSAQASSGLSRSETGRNRSFRIQREKIHEQKVTYWANRKFNLKQFSSAINAKDQLKPIPLPLCLQAPPTMWPVLTKGVLYFKVAAPELLHLRLSFFTWRGNSVSAEHSNGSGSIPGSFEGPNILLKFETTSSNLEMVPVKSDLLKLVCSRQTSSALQGENSYSLWS